jgi:hypothetical protein
MLAAVHRRPPPSANCTNSTRLTAGERSRTGVNETKTEPRPGPGPCSGVAAESLDGSSPACVVVTGRRQRFVLHAIPNRALPSMRCLWIASSPRPGGTERPVLARSLLVAVLCRATAACGVGARGSYPWRLVLWRRVWWIRPPGPVSSTRPLAPPPTASRPQQSTAAAAGRRWSQRQGRPGPTWRDSAPPVGMGRRACDPRRPRPTCAYRA